MTEPVQQRIAGLDIVRCLMNYMIVLLHAWAAFQYVDCTTWEFYGWTFVCSHLCAMALPAFFLVSGYLMFRKFSFSAWPEKMFRRLKRLFVPYLVWNITFVVVYIVFAKFVPRLSTRVEMFGLDSFWGCFSKVLSLTVVPIDGPLWFIRSLLILSLLSPLLWLLMRHIRGIVLLVCCLVWIGGEMFFGASKFLNQTLPAYAVFCFVLGGVLSVNGKDVMAVFKKRRWFALGVVACVLHAVILIPYSVTPQTPTMLYRLIANYLFILGAPAMISLVANMNTDLVAKSKMFPFLKDMSFFAYAGHFLICSSYLHLIAPRLHWMHSFKFTLLIFVFVLLGIPTLALIYIIGRRFSPKVLKLWDGTL